jgi:hypothetical protein
MIEAGFGLREGINSMIQAAFGCLAPLTFLFFLHQKLLPIVPLRFKLLKPVGGKAPPRLGLTFRPPVLGGKR